MPAYNGDSSFREAAVRSFNFYKKHYRMIIPGSSISVRREMK
jgi:hypothetical protein